MRLIRQFTNETETQSKIASHEIKLGYLESLQRIVVSYSDELSTKKKLMSDALAKLDEKYKEHLQRDMQYVLRCFSD